MKKLTAVNYTQKSLGLKRDLLPDYAAMTSVIYNFRRHIHNLGYDCSLLTDGEILGFADVIFESTKDNSESLLKVLDFLTEKPTNNH